MALQLGPRHSLKPNDAQSTLQTMGYDQRYIHRAMSVHQRSRGGAHYNLSLLVEIISRLELKDQASAQQTPFRAHFPSPHDTLTLRVGDTVDYRFENGRFILCRITDILSDAATLTLHPLTEPQSTTRHDRQCHRRHDYRRLAPPRSVSLRQLTSAQHPLYGLAIDDYVDIHPPQPQAQAARGWTTGRIIKTESKSGQIKVLYADEHGLNNRSRWVHLENALEVAPKHTKCRSVRSKYF